VLFAALLTILLATGAFAKKALTPQGAMVAEMLAMPSSEWQSHLKAHRSLLDDEFFTNVSKRIRWGIENNQVDDAFQFAPLGDFAADVVGRSPSYRMDLAELFFTAQNFPRALQFLESVLVVNPESSEASRAKFLGAQIKELQEDIPGAYTDFLDLANKAQRDLVALWPAQPFSGQ
jgi:hypothetical protein